MQGRFISPTPHLFETVEERAFSALVSVSDQFSF
jgi:hypothetical protein